jgi:hypothetical protein
VVVAKAAAIVGVLMIVGATTARTPAASTDVVSAASASSITSAHAICA